MKTARELLPKGCSLNYRALVPITLAAVVAFAQTVVFIAQEAGRVTEILAAARKAIGDKKLDSLKTFSVQSALQRNVATFLTTPRMFLRRRMVHSKSSAPSATLTRKTTSRP